MDLHWGFSLGIPWKYSMGKSVGVPMGMAWTCIGAAQGWGHPWHSSMGSALGICPCASMDLHWGFSLGIPWKSSMGKSVGVPMGMAWTCIGSSQWAIYGIALGAAHGGIHGILLWVVHWAFAHVHLWICTGASHWASHGSLQWVSQWVSPWAWHGLALGVLNGQP